MSRALADFDAATIATTHEFCLRMLDDLGVLGDPEPDAVFVEHLAELTAEVARDVYLRRYATESSPPLPFRDALQLADQVIAAGPIRLVPGLGAGVRSDERVTFAHEVVTEVRRRKERARYLTYDDMLTRLQAALADERHGELAAQRLRERFPVVLVDEFQDTDPIQWDILRRAFHGHGTLVVIGDPKQAIYAFRGADVNSYLQVAREAGTIATLGTCYRSDRALLDGLDLIMGGASLGDPAIVVRPVGSDHPDRRLTGAGAPVRVRVAATKGGRRAGVRQTAAQARREGPGGRDRRTAGVRRARLAAGRRRPATGASIRPGGPGSPERGRRADPRRVGRRRHPGRPARLGLGLLLPRRAGLAAVLLALEQPRQALGPRAALTDLVGWTFPRLAQADEPALADLAYDVPPLESDAGLARRRRADGDHGHRHRAERAGAGPSRRRTAAHRPAARRPTAARRDDQQGLGVAGLREWLAEAIEAATTDDVHRGSPPAGHRRGRRPGADPAPQQGSRSSPIVYLPEAWDCFVPTDERDAVLRLHDDGTEVLDVGGRQAAGRPERWRQSLAEEAGEHLRLNYVGMTRAQCQVVTWWADSRNTATSALHRFWARSGPIRRAGGELSRRPGPGDETMPRSVPRHGGDVESLREIESLLAVEPVQQRPPCAGRRRVRWRRHWRHAGSPGCWTPPGGAPRTRR